MYVGTLTWVLWAGFFLCEPYLRDIRHTPGAHLCNKHVMRYSNFSLCILLAGTVYGLGVSAWGKCVPVCQEAAAKRQLMCPDQLVH